MKHNFAKGGTGQMIQQLINRRNQRFSAPNKEDHN